MDKVTVIDQSAEVTNPPSGTSYVQKAEIGNHDPGLSANTFLFIILVAFLVITVIIYKAVTDAKKNKVDFGDEHLA
jgi:hypothetical protein